jgi:hypothetical protein
MPFSKNSTMLPGRGYSAFHGAYDSAMVIMADASKKHTFFGGMRSIRPELIDRFGTETGIHLVPIRLH